MAAAATPPAASRPGWFAVPAPVRGLFDIFPLRVYGPEALPVRSPAATRTRPALYVFIADDDAPHGLPSFNPSCLKWQTLLRIAGVDVDIVPSNNHASPSGALPFLLPPSSSSQRPPVPLTGEKIYKYALEHTARELPDVTSPRLEAYQALLTQNIRPAWLHALYLIPANAPLLTNLYLPSSALLRASLHHTLHAAATSEILKTTRCTHISPPQLYADAAAALRSLSAILADDNWFFGASGPGLFDADVFAYTYLMLDDALAWRDTALAGCLDGLHNLRRHRNRLYERCWGEKAQ
ncbi:hypothetical protein BGZ61DRAFT_493620 [Ilyonectria robusta]|uniref:uncharacterized protein n=1 Tax=Ilyonectria robusta TaxID=1079257 RepID=UPI001E8E5BDE|nr:uncharacterized protein BGZ61DRAFT_493620 [Ilyonectria robusta]KAH8699561.1 hypothetical protein BGZ61DRAFT_493620 [Ilyonectria robusta]